MNNDTLQAMISEQMQLLRNHKVDPKNVNAMVNAAAKILSSVKLELEYARMCGVRPHITFIHSRGIASLPKIELPKIIAPKMPQMKGVANSKKKRKAA